MHILFCQYKKWGFTNRMSDAVVASTTSFKLEIEKSGNASRNWAVFVNMIRSCPASFDNPSPMTRRTPNKFHNLSYAISDNHLNVLRYLSIFMALHYFTGCLSHNSYDVPATRLVVSLFHFILVFCCTQCPGRIGVS